MAKPLKYFVILAVLGWVSVLSATPWSRMVLQPPAAASTFNGTIFYLDVTNGSDANSGLSPGAAWQHLHYAMTNAQFRTAYGTTNVWVQPVAGDFFADTNFIMTNINPSPYQVIVAPVTGLVTNTNWVQSNPKEPQSSQGFAGLIIDSSYITISNFYFLGQQPWYGGTGITTAPLPGALTIESFLATTHHITVSNCFYQWTGWGLQLSANDDTHHITNVVVIGGCANSNSATGFLTENNSDNNYSVFNTFVTNLVISNINGSVTPSFIGNGMFIGQASNIWLSHCLLSNAVYNGPTGSGPVAVDWQYSTGCHLTDGSEIARWVWNGQDDGGGVNIDVGSWSDSIERSYIHDCDGPGILLYASGASITGSNLIRFNVLGFNGAKSTGSPPGGEIVFYQMPSAITNCLIYNNTFACTNGVIPILVSSASGGNGSLGANCILANNILTVSNVANGLTVGGTGGAYTNQDYHRFDGTAFTISYNGTGSQSIAGWGKDPDALTADPLWSNGVPAIPGYMPSLYPNVASQIGQYFGLKSSSTMIGAAFNMSASYANGGLDITSNTVASSGYSVGAVNTP